MPVPLHFSAPAARVPTWIPVAVTCEDVGETHAAESLAQEFAVSWGESLAAEAESQRGKIVEGLPAQLSAVGPAKIAVAGGTFVVPAAGTASFDEGFVLQLRNFLEQVATSA